MGAKAEEIRKQLRADARMARANLHTAKEQGDEEQINYWTGAMVAFDRSVTRAGRVIGS